MGILEILQEELKEIKSILCEMRQQPYTSKADTSDQWFDIIRLRDYLPSKPAKPTVYEWVGKRLIPYHKNGKKLAFLKSEIDEWLKSGRRKTALELREEAAKFIKKKRAA